MMNSISTPSIKRKCACCHEEIIINKVTINEAIFYENKAYHKDCFISLVEKMSSSNRKTSIRKWSGVLDRFETIRVESANHYMNGIVKEELNSFMQDNYDILIIPSTIWTKIMQINNGTWKNIGVRIPNEDILDMWKRKIDYLNKVADKNVTCGKSMTNVQRINYDLSILLNKYDSYVKWKENNKRLEIEEEERKTEIEKVKATQTIISDISLRQEKIKKDSDNISDLVYEIFG